MPKTPEQRIELVQGTLDMLVLRTLLLGPMHGHAIAVEIQRNSDDVLKINHGSLYPALYRLLQNGWITSSWQLMPDRKREANYYRLTAAGKKRLADERAKWKLLTRAIAKVMQPI